jgi:hypothetical protein
MEEGEEVERGPPAPLLQAGDRLLESWICQNKGKYLQSVIFGTFF